MRADDVAVLLVAALHGRADLLVAHRHRPTYDPAQSVEYGAGYGDFPTFFELRHQLSDQLGIALAGEVEETFDVVRCLVYDKCIERLNAPCIPFDERQSVNLKPTKGD